MDGAATSEEKLDKAGVVKELRKLVKRRRKAKRVKVKSNKKHPFRKRTRARKGNKKARVGRPPRGEGTTVVGVVLKKGERQGVRVADSLFAKLNKGAKAAGVPVSVLLRAGGIYLAELVVGRKWKKAQVEAFLKKYGGAS